MEIRLMRVGEELGSHTTFVVDVLGPNAPAAIEAVADLFSVTQAAGPFAIAGATPGGTSVAGLRASYLVVNPLGINAGELVGTLRPFGPFSLYVLDNPVAEAAAEVAKFVAYPFKAANEVLDTGVEITKDVGTAVKNTTEATANAAGGLASIAAILPILAVVLFVVLVAQGKVKL